jgi:hypothetical protein
MVMARAAYHACEDWREGPICFVASSGPPCGVLGVRLSRALLGASHLDPSRQSSRAYPRYFHTVVCDHDQIDGQRSELPIASAATSGSWRAGESGCGESTAGRGSPPCSGSRAGACHQSSQRSGTVQHSPRYTAPLAAFTVLRSSAEISWTDGVWREMPSATTSVLTKPHGRTFVNRYRPWPSPHTLAALLLGTLLIPNSGALAQAPNIEGTYRLVSRTLPDGTVQKPPDVIGLQTYERPLELQHLVEGPRRTTRLTLHRRDLHPIPD